MSQKDFVQTVPCHHCSYEIFHFGGLLYAESYLLRSSWEFCVAIFSKMSEKGNEKETGTEAKRCFRESLLK